MFESGTAGIGLSRSWVLGAAPVLGGVPLSKVLIGPGAVFGGPAGAESPDGLDDGQVGVATVDEVPFSPGGVPAEPSGSDGAAITPGLVIGDAGETGTGEPMITGLAPFIVTGLAGGAITVETGALETYELQPGLAKP